MTLGPAPQSGRHCFSAHSLYHQQAEVTFPSTIFQINNLYEVHMYVCFQDKERLEMAQVRALAALVGDPGSDPSTHIVGNYSSKDSNSPFRTPPALHDIAWVHLHV